MSIFIAFAIPEVEGNNWVESVDEDIAEDDIGDETDDDSFQERFDEPDEIDSNDWDDDEVEEFF